MTRTVTGKLITGDGSSLADVYIYFRPMIISAFKTGGAGMVSPEPIEIITDNLGEFTIDLLATEDYDADTSTYVLSKPGYRIEVPELGLVRYVSVADGVGSVDWGSLAEDLD